MCLLSSQCEDIMDGTPPPTQKQLANRKLTFHWLKCNHNGHSKPKGNLGNVVFYCRKPPDKNGCGVAEMALLYPFYVSSGSTGPGWLIEELNSQAYIVLEKVQSSLPETVRIPQKIRTQNNL